MIKFEKVRFLALSLLSSAVISISLLLSNFFSMKNVNFLVFFIGLSLYIIMVSQLIIDYKKVGLISKLFSAFISILLISASFLGSQNTINVNGKNLLFFSNEKKIYDLAIELRDELYIIQENQIFFTYPSQQVSTMSDLLIAAAGQAARISKKRNPALIDKLPAQEFFLLYEKINKLSELQKNNLNNFINYSNEPTDAFKIEINTINQDINLLILDSATILKALAKQYSFSLERETNE
jgi:hypothetical protein